MWKTESLSTAFHIYSHKSYSWTIKDTRPTLKGAPTRRPLCPLWAAGGPCGHRWKPHIQKKKPWPKVGAANFMLVLGYLCDYGNFSGLWFVILRYKQLKSKFHYKLFFSSLIWRQCLVLIFFYLFKRPSESETELYHPLHFPNRCRVGHTGLASSQELHLGFPHESQGPRHLRTLLLPSKTHYHGPAW